MNVKKNAWKHFFKYTMKSWFIPVNAYMYTREYFLFFFPFYILLYLKWFFTKWSCLHTLKTTILIKNKNPKLSGPCHDWHLYGVCRCMPDYLIGGVNFPRSCLRGVHVFSAPKQQRLKGIWFVCASSIDVFGLLVRLIIKDIHHPTFQEYVLLERIVVEELNHTRLCFFHHIMSIFCHCWFCLFHILYFIDAMTSLSYIYFNKTIDVCIHRWRGREVWVVF